MKYFNPSYGFKLGLLSSQLFNDKTQGINAKSIDNKKIKDGASNNTSLESINQEMNYTNSTTNYQSYNLNQISNQELGETSTHKHRHEKSRNRYKRGQNHGNEIESGSEYIYGSFKPEFGEEIVKIYHKYGCDTFINEFKNKTYDYYGYKNDIGIDGRISGNGVKNYAKVIYNNFEKLSNIFENSPRIKRIRIVTQNIDIIEVGIRYADTKNYCNGYLDNLKRDFPDGNSDITINLGLIDSDYYIKSAIQKKYNILDISKISIFNKKGYSLGCKCYQSQIKVNSDNNYSYGKTKPILSYITKTKLNEISNYIANDPKGKQGLEHISEGNFTLSQSITNAKTFTPELLYNGKRQEKEIIKGYIRDGSYVSTLIEHELKLDELNKNVQGLKSSFDSIKNQINELDKRIVNLENTSNFNCANTVGIVGGVISAIPVIGTVGGAVATITSGACAIAGV